MSAKQVQPSRTGTNVQFKLRRDATRQLAVTTSGSSRWSRCDRVAMVRLGRLRRAKGARLQMSMQRSQRLESLHIAAGQVHELVAISHQLHAFLVHTQQVAAQGPLLPICSAALHAVCRMPHVRPHGITDRVLP